jgi:hypothetical protein
MNVYYKVLTGLADEMIDPLIPKSSIENTPLYGLNAWLNAAILQEPSDEDIDGDLTLRGPVTRWIGYAFGQPRISRSEAINLLPIEPGDPNPLFQIFDSIDKESGSSVVFGDSTFELTTAGPVKRPLWLAKEYVIALVLTGGDAVNYQVWFEFDDPDSETPSLLPNSTITEYINEENVTRQLKWSEWMEPETQQILQYGDKYYKPAVNNNGVPMLATEWVPLYINQIVNVVSKSELQNIQSLSLED